MNSGLVKMHIMTAKQITTRLATEVSEWKQIKPIIKWCHNHVDTDGWYDM